MTSHATGAVAPADIETWLKTYIAELVGTSPDQIASDMGFESFGIDSVQSIDMANDLGVWLNLPIELPIELLFEERTIADAAKRVAAVQANGPGQP